MSEAGRKDLETIAKALDTLPEDKRQFLLGIATGVELASKGEQEETN